MDPYNPYTPIQDDLGGCVAFLGALLAFLVICYAIAWLVEKRRERIARRNKPKLLVDEKRKRERR